MSDLEGPSVPWPPSTGVTATYPMACHCTAIQWTITLSPPLLDSESEGKGIYTAVECDCTHCERKGMISCHLKKKDIVFSQGIVSSHRSARTYPWLASTATEGLCAKQVDLLETSHAAPVAKANPRSLARSTGASTSALQKRTRIGSASCAVRHWERI